jgi:hypothetical protein
MVTTKKNYKKAVFYLVIRNNTELGHQDCDEYTPNNAKY